MVLHDYEPTGLERRQAAIAAFNRARRDTEKSLLQLTGSRESRMDAARRLEVLHREQAALRARSRGRAQRAERLASPRAIVAHRHRWTSQKLVELLALEDVEVVEHGLDNGADAVGAAVAEQPELILLEDGLLMLPGEEVVQEIRRFCPVTVVAVQASSSDRIGVLLDAGAHAVTTRATAPADYLGQALSLVRQT